MCIAHGDNVVPSAVLWHPAVLVLPPYTGTFCRLDALGKHRRSLYDNYSKTVELLYAVYEYVSCTSIDSAAYLSAIRSGASAVSRTAYRTPQLLQSCNVHTPRICWKYFALRSSSVGGWCRSFMIRHTIDTISCVSRNKVVGDVEFYLLNPDDDHTRQRGK